MGDWRLGETDLGRLSRAADALGAARTLDDVRHQTLASLPDLVSSDGASWHEVDLDAPTVAGVVVRLELDRTGHDTTFDADIADHPVVSYYRSTGDARPKAISDFLSSEEFHATTLYQCYFSRLGAEDEISFMLPGPGPSVVVAAYRRNRGWSTGERALLGLLRLHVAQAYRAVSDRADAERLRSILEDVVEGHDEHLVVLSPRGEVEHLSPSTGAVLASWFGDLEPGHLPGELGDWLDARRSDPDPLEPLVRRRSGERLVVRRLADARGQVLLLSVPGAPVDVSLASLGLSEREAEVLRHACAGLSSGAIASRLGISTRTVDKHFQRIYAKLGVSTRVAATSLVHSLRHAGHFEGVPGERHAADLVPSPAGNSWVKQSGARP